MSINRFDGEYWFLSNFSPSQVWFDGRVFPTVEHAFQAAKTLDSKARKEIQRADTPGQAKRLGRKVTLRSNWESIKLKIMEDLLKEKFHPDQNEYLAAKLVETLEEGYLEEGNNWGDMFWGTCNGKGENHLGKLLMKIRDKINVGYDPIGGGGGHGRSDLPYGQGGGGD